MVKNLNFLLLSVLHFLFCLDISSYAQDRETMSWQIYNRNTEDISLSFSIFRMENENKNNIVYFFHGAGGDELSWLDTGEKIRQSWIDNSINPPIVVGISLGETWNLTPEKLNNSQSIPIIKNEVFGFIERELGPFDQVSGIGVSMGGFNLLQLLIDDPSFFDKLLLISPAIADLNPFSTNEEIEDYVLSSNSLSLKQKIKAFLTRNIPTDKIIIILNFWKDLINSYEQWNEIDPFIQLAEIDRIHSEVLITCGKNDIYGFYDGSKKLYNIVKEKTPDVYLYSIKNESHLIYPTTNAIHFSDGF